MKEGLLRFRARFVHLADTLRGSYWFVPAVMALGATALAGGMILLDSRKGSAWMDGVAWLHAAHPDGARQVLAAIGGSMITVAGTVFSVTIAAVVYASGQYGPRLLSNFMSDRGNKVTLGTFIGTFLYCLIVLRTIRSPQESGGAGFAFVPNLSLLVGVLLAFCSIAVLIFFIHHVPSRIHINSVIEGIGDRLLREIDRRFPRLVGAPPSDEERTGGQTAVPAAFQGEGRAGVARGRFEVTAQRTGYIQMIDEAVILSAAQTHDLVLRLRYQPGDFIHVGRRLVDAWPEERCNDDVVSSIRDAFAVGARRSATQDLRFLIDELVEIAARALSPGVNDPFTAVTCLDWLGAALADLASRPLPSHLRFDSEHALRIIAHPITFEGFVDQAFGTLAQYCARDMVASLHYLGALGEVALDCEDAARLSCLTNCAGKLDELAGHALEGFNRSRVHERARELRRALSEPDPGRRQSECDARLGGTAAPGDNG